MSRDSQHEEAQYLFHRHNLGWWCLQVEMSLLLHLFNIFSCEKVVKIEWDFCVVVIILLQTFLFQCNWHSPPHQFWNAVKPTSLWIEWEYRNTFSHLIYNTLLRTDCSKVERNNDLVNNSLFPLQNVINYLEKETCQFKRWNALWLSLFIERPIRKCF